MKHRSLEEHLFSPGPKRMLALDGGGVRGALTLSMLERVEQILRERHGGDPEFRLCDYFDLIGGTSTGSIIATGLALGMTVKELQQLYAQLTNDIFKTKLFNFGLLSPKFNAQPLSKALNEVLGNRTLGSEDLKTGLMVVTKRLDTGSPWPLHNNPRGRYYSTPEGEDFVPNSEYLLRDVVRASTAAPHYFEPEELRIHAEGYGAFVDGGVSPFNNPALQTLMMATVEGYGLKWPFGEDNLLLVSLGTGMRSFSFPPSKVMKMKALEVAAHSIASIMRDTNVMSQVMLQWMSHSPTSWILDSEIGTLEHEALGGAGPLLSYLRYDVLFDKNWFKENLGLEIGSRKVKSLFAMDDPKNVPMLAEVGRAAAEARVRPEHFRNVFDLDSWSQG